jgi:hypothetical protein
MKQTTLRPFRLLKDAKGRRSNQIITGNDKNAFDVVKNRLDSS